MSDVYTGSVAVCVLCIMCLRIPVLHALVHAAVLDTLFLHVRAASSQTLYCLLEVLLLQSQLLHLTSAHTHTHTHIHS